MAWLRPQLVVAGPPAEYAAWCFSNGSIQGQEYSSLHNSRNLVGGHVGGGNVAYIDGHADYRPSGSLHPSDFGLIGIPTSSSNDPNTVSQSVDYYGAFDN